MNVRKDVGKRIHVVGTSGSGKTTLAKQIAAQLQIQHIEMDALHWDANWTNVSTEVFRQRLEQVLVGDRWVIDGNYSRVRDLVWSRADTVVWLNYPFWLVFSRIVQRTLWRGLTRQELWNGNRESLRTAFSKDSMIVWMLKTYKKRQQQYPIWFQQPEAAHLTIVELRSPQAAEAWLKEQS
ncbi:MAG: AAA family ATPase [Drouetiella hepatica Uher 2000/2452]|jgi:adenylate kinase family enzyme|uniref:AAA family ATPase n=1 Tax=Drouetiella hepatica Uher 2000/2452 TaxID=904376 RepID=A0A951UM15_9CYAN|nr:AAA family ATPase [Drouetiella hepatica Uher 2000/2452]